MRKEGTAAVTEEEEMNSSLKRCRSSGESSTGESSEEKAQIPCLLSYNINGPVLYGVDYFGDGTPPLRQMSPGGNTAPGGNMVVALGSTVYVLGGIVRKTTTEEEEEEEEDEEKESIFTKEEYKTHFEFCRDVVYFEVDRVKPEEEEDTEVEGWKRAPDMLNARNRGKAIIVEGKIYVFGGTHLDKAQDPWAEVFDPIKNKWEPLPPPPVYLNENELMNVPVVAYGGGPSSEAKIMLGTEDTKYVYNVKSGTWEQPAWPVYGGYGLKPVGVGNILYYTSKGKLIAANMKTQRHYMGKIEGSKLGCSSCDYHPDPEPQLVHLGGKQFCFFTIDSRRRTKVCCTKFRVTKRIRNKSDDMGSLKGSIVSRVACVVDQPLQDNGLHCFLLDAMPGGKKEGEGPQKLKKSKKYLSRKKSAREMELAI